jgi:hypothetical protein
VVDIDCNEDKRGVQPEKTVPFEILPTLILLNDL